VNFGCYRFVFPGRMNDGALTGITLNKVGPGQVILDNTAASPNQNDLNGTTLRASAGKLVVLDSGAASTTRVLGGSPLVQIAGGTLVLDSKVNSYTLTNPITVTTSGTLEVVPGNSTLVHNTGAITIGAGQTLTVAVYGGNNHLRGALLRVDSVIGGGGNLTQTNIGTNTEDTGNGNFAGQLQLNNNTNSYSGTTAVNGGILMVSQSNGLGAASGDTTVAAGAQLRLQNTVVLPAGESITLNGSGIANAGALRSENQNNTVSGQVVMGSAARIVANTAGTLLTLGGGINLTAGPVTFEGSGDTLVSGTIMRTANTHGVIKGGAGTTTFSTANSYQGVTTVSAGVLAISDDNQLGAVPGSPTVGNVVLGGGLLRADGSTVLHGNRGLSVPASINGAVGCGAGIELDIAGSISVLANGGLSVNPGGLGGDVRLSGPNTYASHVTVLGGRLIAAHDQALGAVSASSYCHVVPGAAFALDAGVTLPAGEVVVINGDGPGGTGALQGLSGINTFAGSVHLGSAATVTCAGAGDRLVLSGGVEAHFPLTVDGAGTVDVQGSLSGQTGFVPGVQESRLPGAFDITNSPGGGRIVSSVRNAATNAKPPWGDNETWVYRGQIFDADGTFALAESVDDSTRIQINGTTRLQNGTHNHITTTASTVGRNGGSNVTGANAAGGTTAFGLGPAGDGWHDLEVRLGNGSGGAGATGSGGNSWGTTKGFGYTSTIPADLYAAGNHLVPAGGTASVDGNLRVAVTNLLTKTGSGTLVLSADNTYTGGTIVNQGTLLVNDPPGGSAGTGTGLVAVNPGATLGGTGEIGGALAAASTASVEPGTSVESLAVTNVVFGTGALLEIEIDGASGPGLVGGHDVLVASGSVSLGGGTLTLLGAHVPLVGESFRILDNLSGLPVVGTFASMAEGADLMFNSSVLYITYLGGDGNDVVLVANQNPSDITLGPDAIAENNAPNAVVGGFSTIDPDASDTHTYALVVGTGSTDNGAFTISGSNLLINASANFEAQSSYSIRVRSTDSASPAGMREEIFIITIVNVNEVPTFTDGGDVESDEDAGPQAVVGWALPLDDGDSTVTQGLSFSIASNTNSSLFSVPPALNPVTGTLTYTAAANSNGVASVEVVLTDDNTLNGNDPLSVTNTLQITVHPVNDEPTFACGPNQSVAGNAGPQTVPGWATTISDNDPEVVQGLTFQIVGNTNPGVLSGTPAISSTGTLTYAPSLTQCGRTTISVRLMDDGGTDRGGDDTSPTCSFTIDVLAPEITVHRINGDEYQSGQDTVDFGAVVVEGCVTRKLVLGNICNDTLVLDYSLQSGTAFSIVPVAPASVPPGGHRELYLRFCPEGVGAADDLLTILSNDPDEPAFTVALVGSGFVNDAPLACTPGMLDEHEGVVHAPAAGDSVQGQFVVVGDVNADEIDDLVVVFPLSDSLGRVNNGRIAVYFGGNGYDPGVRDLAGTHGLAPDVVLHGPVSQARLAQGGGLVLADVNGDCIQDIAVVAPGASPNGRSGSGAVHLVLGRVTWPASLDLLSHSSCVIGGNNVSDNLGTEGALAAGDFDGDGISDLATGTGLSLGSSLTRPKAGVAYVLRGRPTWPPHLDLRVIGGVTNYHAIVLGGDAHDYLTEHGALAFGDVNGDGREDLVLAARRADGPGNARLDAGEAYVVRGRPLSVPLRVDLFAGQQDRTLQGAVAGDFLGDAAALAVGDVTGDGRADIVVGTSRHDGVGGARVDAGAAWLVPGTASLAGAVDLASGLGSTAIWGAEMGDALTAGGALRVADLTGDGVGDILLGAEGGDGPDSLRGYAGEVMVLDGRAAWPASLDLADSGSSSLTVYGATGQDMLSRDGGLTTADLNLDGIADLILTAVGGDGFTNTVNGCGEVVVIFGESTWSSATKDLRTTLDGSMMFLRGAASGDDLGRHGVLAVGDLDGDGAPDLLAGAAGVDGPVGAPRANAGAVYRLRGRPGALDCGVGFALIEGPAPAWSDLPAPIILTLDARASEGRTAAVWAEGGRDHVLEVSTDLLHWRDVASDRPGRTGELLLQDREASSGGPRYYRVRREVPSVL
jgi:autotransporter-associated beta strand protein